MGCNLQLVYLAIYFYIYIIIQVDRRFLVRSHADIAGKTVDNDVFNAMKSPNYWKISSESISKRQYSGRI